MKPICPVCLTVANFKLDTRFGYVMFECQSCLQMYMPNEPTLYGIVPSKMLKQAYSIIRDSLGIVPISPQGEH